MNLLVFTVYSYHGSEFDSDKNNSTSLQHSLITSHLTSYILSHHELIMAKKTQGNETKHVKQLFIVIILYLVDFITSKRNFIESTLFVSKS